jgi:Domain of unknown function (DUF4157)
VAFLSAHIPAQQRTAFTPAARLLQGKLSSSFDVRPGLDSVQTVLGSPGHPLDASTREFMENRFGHDFGHVRVHTDGEAPESARALNALAYTVGRDIVFAGGRYAPGTKQGRELLAHELAHVLQQPWRGTGVALGIGEAGDCFECEAGRVANAVMGPAEPCSQTRTPSLRSQPGVVRLQEARPLTEGELKSEAQLRRLASRPGEALTQWKKLNEKERGFVTLVMLGRYGFDFTQDFQQYASGKKKPNISTSVSNAPQDQPKELAKRGYKHAVDNVWVHPSGHEVWVMSPGRKAAPPTEEEEDPQRAKCEALCDETDDEDECSRCCEEKIPETDPRCRRQCQVKCPAKL